MDTIKVGIIGVGGIGQSHLNAYAKNPNFEVVGIAELDGEKALYASTRWDIPKVFSNHHELLEADEIKAVSICTYHTSHASLTIDALNAHKHVLVEKPMATNTQDAAAMTQTAEKRGMVLQVGLQSRFRPEIIEAKRMVSDGILGQIYFAESVHTRRRGIPSESFTRKATASGGAVLDMGVYGLDTALYLMGFPEPVSVSAMTADYIGTQSGLVTAGGIDGGTQWDPSKFEVEDFGAALIRFDDDAVLMFKISWAAHIQSMGESFLLGTKAGLSLNPLTLHRDENGAMVDIAFTNLPKVDTWQPQMEAFLEAVRSGGPSPVPPNEVMLTNVIMDGIYQSAKEHCEVRVTVPQV